MITASITAKIDEYIYTLQTARHIGRRTIQWPNVLITVWSDFECDTPL